MVFHGNTLQPTEAGIVLLRKADVRAEDIILFDFGRQKNLRQRSPTVEQRIQKTLALLKVAEVIAKEKFEKQSHIERQKNVLDRRLGIPNLTNTKFVEAGTPGTMLNQKFLPRRYWRSIVRNNKRDTLSLKASVGLGSPALKQRAKRKLLVRNHRQQEVANNQAPSQD